MVRIRVGKHIAAVDSRLVFESEGQGTSFGYPAPNQIVLTIDMTPEDQIRLGRALMTEGELRRSAS